LVRRREEFFEWDVRALADLAFMRNPRARRYETGTDRMFIRVVLGRATPQTPGG
jgi:hypothetical protein